MRFKESRTQAMAPDARRNGIVVALRATKEGTEYSLGAEARRWIVGTGESCDLVLDDPYVSNVHCTVERLAHGVIQVRDRGSRNGTLIDGNAVQAAELRVGSYLTLGRTTLVAVASPQANHTAAITLLRGHDPVFRATVDQALRAAQTECSILILGETGTGKDLLARLVHEASRRAAGKFVAVNCGAIPHELVGSELFGHEKGAFTGALAERDGYFIEAHGGTLFLDELGELPLELQPHLLRVLEARRVRRVGGASDRPVDVRIIAATNRTDGLGTDGSRVRIDLYHRLATVVLQLPPLRERMGDLRELVESMLEELAPEHGRKLVTQEAWLALATYDWPGNLRELRHAVSRAMALGGDELGSRDFFPEPRMRRIPPPMVGPAPPRPPGPERVHDPDGLAPYQSMMRGAMEQALCTHGTIRAAASYLGMAKSTFADKARVWGLMPRRRPRRPK